MGAKRTVRFVVEGGSDPAVMVKLYEDDLVVELDTDIAAEADDVAVALPTVDVTEASLIFFLADAAMTVKTNSDSAPDDTLSLEAGKAVAWWSGEPVGMKPLSADVTGGLFVSSTPGGRLQVVVLQGA